MQKNKKLYKITVNPPTKGRLPITVVYNAKLKENIKNKILWRNVPDEKGALKKEWGRVASVNDTERRNNNIYIGESSRTIQHGIGKPLLDNNVLNVFFSHRYANGNCHGNAQEKNKGK